MAEPWDVRRVARLFGWILAAGLFLGTVIFALLQFGLIGPEPPRQRIPDFVDSVLDFFRDESEVWPVELSSRLLFTLGFLGLAGLGLTLGRILGREDAGGIVVTGTFGLAGVLGVVAQLIGIGAKEVAIEPRFCDCRYAPEEVIGRLEALRLAENAERWLFYGLFLLSAVGLFVIGRMAVTRGTFARGWAYLSYIIAALFLVGIVTQVFELDLAFDLTVAVGGGLLTPVWAIWLGRQLQRGTITSP